MIAISFWEKEVSCCDRLQKLQEVLLLLLLFYSTDGGGACCFFFSEEHFCCFPKLLFSLMLICATFQTAVTQQKRAAHSVHKNIYIHRYRAPLAHLWARCWARLLLLPWVLYGYRAFGIPIRPTERTHPAFLSIEKKKSGKDVPLKIWIYYYTLRYIRLWGWEREKKRRIDERLREIKQPHRCRIPTHTHSKELRYRLRWRWLFDI